VLDDSSFREGSLCVVGNINRDVKAAPIPGTNNLFQDGETSLPWVVETIGGGGANSACAAAALGARVAFLGKVGNDGLAARLARTLRRSGVEDHLIRTNSMPTGTSLALSFTNGHRHFLSCLPASQNLSFTDLDLAPLADCRHLLRADVWFSESMLFEGNQSLLEHSRNAGLDVSLDINWDPAWNVAAAKTVASRKGALRKILPYVNVAHGNIRELCTFSGSTDLDDALKSITRWGAESIVIHCGERGAGYFDGNELIIEPPVLAKTHLNTTGTGDVLSVCMMLLHRSGAEMRDRLRLANQIVSQFIEGHRRLIPQLED